MHFKFLKNGIKKLPGQLVLILFKNYLKRLIKRNIVNYKNDHSFK